jgi:hypothetical protein
MDYSVRRSRQFKDNHIFVTIPYSKMDGLMQSIDLCSAGTARHELRPPVRTLDKNG